MKSLSLQVRSVSLAILGTVFLLCSAVESHAADVKVFLLGGQSNMLGRAPSSGLPTSPVNLQEPQDDVLFYYNNNIGLTTLRPGSGKFTTEFGPEVSFGRAIADAYPSDNIALIKYAAGGTSLYNDWAPGTGAQYTNFRNTVTAGIAALQAAGHTTEIVGMLWHQGESDAIAGQQANYANNLTAFIADIRSNYGANLPFLIGEIRRSNGPAFVTVADAQVDVAAADQNAIFVPASDLTFKDTYHFDAPSQVTLGERFASGFITLDTGETTLSLLGITDDQGGGPVVPGTSVTYSVSFSEDMDATTVSSADFENAGTATVTWGAISETTPGVFSLTVTPISSGTLQLQVVQNAELLAQAGKKLDTTAPIADETVITVTESGSGAIVAGTVIGVDFGGVPDGNFNAVTADGTVTNLIDTTGATLTGVNVTTSDSLVFNGNADHTKTGQPSQFTQEHLKDWVVFSGGVTYTITFTGLDDALTYDLVIGGANGSGFPVDTTWSAGGQTLTTDAGTSSSTDGSGAYVSFTGLETDGSGNLAITGLKASNYGVASALELTAVPTNTFATWIAGPAFGLDAADQAWGLDPDGDGIANALEAWFGTHPGEFSKGLTKPVTVNNTITFTHGRNTEVPTDVAGGFYEWSNNLVDWYSSGMGPEGGPTVTMVPVTNGNSTSVTATPSEPIESLFFRANISRD